MDSLFVIKQTLFVVPSSTGIEGRALHLLGTMCSTIELQPQQENILFTMLKDLMN